MTRRGKPSSGGRSRRPVSTSVNGDMSNDPDQIRAQVADLLGEYDDVPLDTASELDALAVRLEQAHDVLVGALESVEKG